MSKEAFLQRLKELLAGVPATEAEEAIQYYEDYFADAGVENEEKVIEELGTPEKVAANIRRDLGYEQGAENFGSYSGQDTEHHGAYADQNVNGQGMYSGQSNGDYSTYHSPYGDGTCEEKKDHSGAWVIVAICTCWLWFPLLIVAASVLFALSVAVLAVVLSLGVVAFALFLVAIVLLGLSIVKLVLSPAGGFVLLGGALVVGGLAILLVLLVSLVFGKAVPAFFGGIGSLCRRVFRRGGKVS